MDHLSFKAIFQNNRMHSLSAHSKMPRSLTDCNLSVDCLHAVILHVTIELDNLDRDDLLRSKFRVFGSFPD